MQKKQNSQTTTKNSYSSFNLFCSIYWFIFSTNQLNLLIRLTKNEEKIDEIKNCWGTFLQKQTQKNSVTSASVIVNVETSIPSINSFFGFKFSSDETKQKQISTMETTYPKSEEKKTEF
jgi:hypothetical protein